MSRCQNHSTREGKKILSVRSEFFSRILGVLFVMLACTAVATFFLAQKWLQDILVQDHVRILHFAAKNIDHNLQDSLDRLTRLSRLSNTKDRLETFLESESLFRSIHVYDPLGKLLLHARRSDQNAYQPEKNIHDLPNTQMIRTFEAAVRKGQPQLSPLVLTSRGALYQVYFVPILDSKGRVVQILSGAVFPQISKLENFLTGMQMADENWLLLDTGPRGGLIPRRQVDLIQHLEGIRQGGTSLDQVHSLKWAGEEYLVLQEKIGDTGYRLVWGVSQKQAQKKLQTVLKYVLVFFSLCALLSFWVSSLLSRRASRPVDLSVEALEQYHLGNFSKRIREESREFRNLYHLINKLGEKLEKDQALGEFWTNEDELEKIKKGEPI